MAHKTKIRLQKKIAIIDLQNKLIALEQKLAEIKKIAQDAKFDVDYFNTHKLPELVNDTRQKVLDELAEQRASQKPTSSSSNWNWFKKR